MTLLERLRRMAECLPPGASISLGRDWLVEELDREAVQSGEAGDLTVNQVCGLLGRKPSTVRAMCARGDLRAYRFRNAEWRVAASAITEYLARERAGAVETREATSTSSDPLTAWQRVHRPENRGKTA